MFPAYIMRLYLAGKKPNILTYQRTTCNEWKEQLQFGIAVYNLKFSSKCYFSQKKKKRQLGAKVERHLNFFVFQ